MMALAQGSATAANMTGTASTGTAKVFEAGSFALVAALGLYLLARKSRAALAMPRGGDSHAHHGHHHHHHGHPRLAPRSLGAAAVDEGPRHFHDHDRPRITERCRRRLQSPPWASGRAAALS
jgi:ABC-type nickel/cobalt efflux system permease component RcnA